MTSSNGRIKSHRDLEVWQDGVSLSVSCYRFTRAFPKDELFGLTSQIRRSATSVPANLAEGHSRGTRKDYLHFVRLAASSLAELDTHLYVSKEVGLAPAGEIDAILEDVARLGRRLNALIQALARDPISRGPTTQPLEPRT